MYLIVYLKINLFHNLMKAPANILYIELYEAAYKQLELCPYTTMPQHGRWGIVFIKKYIISLPHL